MELDGTLESEEDVIRITPDMVVPRKKEEEPPIQEKDPRNVKELKHKARKPPVKSKQKLIFIENRYKNIDDCFFVIDGANVAKHIQTPSTKGRILNLELPIKKLKLFDIKNYMIICDRNLNYSIDDQKKYTQMVESGEIYETPGGSDADNYILKIAQERDAYIISNDMFRDKYVYFVWC